MWPMSLHAAKLPPGGAGCLHICNITIGALYMEEEKKKDNLSKLNKLNAIGL